MSSKFYKVNPNQVRAASKLPLKIGIQIGVTGSSGISLLEFQMDKSKTEMKLKIIVFILTVLASCTPRKAIDFKAAIVQKEQPAFDILLAEGGPEEEELNCLIKRDFKGALLAIDKQEQGFNTIIAQITTMSADEVNTGADLKKIAADYYISLRDLHTFERKKIAQQEITFSNNTEAVRKAQDKLLELSQQHLLMSKKTQEKRAVLQHALQQFDKANNL